MSVRFRLFTVIALAAALAGCKSKGDIVVQEGIGVTALRTPCPSVGIPDNTGDITLFNGSGEKTAAAIALTANITNVRTTCDDTGAQVYSVASFDVFARRTDVSGPARVQLPYFATVMRGGNIVVSKRVGTVTLDFPAGQERARATAQAGAYIDRAEATLSEDIRKQITRKRKSGDSDAAIDPLAQPEVRAAVARASFELLVGFQLNQDQLAYNVTR